MSCVLFASHVAAEVFLFGGAFFRFEAAFFGAFAGFGGAAFFGGGPDRHDHFAEFRQAIFLVAALVAGELAGDHHFAFIGEAGGVLGEEALFDSLGKARCFAGVPFELGLAADLVDVLATGAAAAGILEMELVFGNFVGLG